MNIDSQKFIEDEQKFREIVKSFLTETEKVIKSIVIENGMIRTENVTFEELINNFRDFTINLRNKIPNEAWKVSFDSLYNAFNETLMEHIQAPTKWVSEKLYDK